MYHWTELNDTLLHQLSPFKYTHIEGPKRRNKNNNNIMPSNTFHLLDNKDNSYIMNNPNVIYYNENKNYYTSILFITAETSNMNKFQHYLFGALCLGEDKKPKTLLNFNIYDQINKLYYYYPHNPTHFSQTQLQITPTAIQTATQTATQTAKQTAKQTATQTAKQTAPEPMEVCSDITPETEKALVW